MRRKERSIWPLVLGVAIVGGLGAVYYSWQQDQASTQQELALPPPAPVARDFPSAAPAIAHPIEDAEVQPSPVTESGPSSSTAPMADAIPFEQALAEVLGAAPLRDFFILEDFVNRLVITIDNLPNEKLTRRLVPLTSVGGVLAVTGGMHGKSVSADNDARYAPHVALLQSLDLPKLAALYVRYYDAFQQAYVSLGDPHGYFNDRLVAVIDHLLATPDISTPLGLVQPGVLYKFADPELETRSAGQKILLRMGSANAAIVKVRLLELRRLVTRPTEPGPLDAPSP